jgi:triacylglycerol lipase
MVYIERMRIRKSGFRSLFPTSLLALGLAFFLPVPAIAEPDGSSSVEPADFPPELPRNDCPVILVHGILAYGQDQRLPISAWGGTHDYRRLLEDEGWGIFSATLGPVSSNWDRACDLFAYIKGGRTDYGAAHSARCGHERFGREYPGVYGAWGNEHKVHLLCHSMGGQTARLLVQLLEAGVPEELAASPEDVSPLFTGGHSWVLGLVTLCSPHDGTSLALTKDYGSEKEKREICGILAAVSSFYDARLDQWGLERRKGESVGSYASRLRANVSWYLGEDGCYEDLRPAGAAKLNAWVRAWPDVYYFSWAASDTYEFEGRQEPLACMQPLLVRSAREMGRFLGRDGPWTIGREWQTNDGTVNSISMDGPKLNSEDRIVPFSGTAVRGVWNYMGLLKETDHVDLLGFATPPWYKPPGFANRESWYRYNLRLLASLED